MTDEQINQAIAETCGWTDIHDSGPWHNHTLWGYPPMNPGQGGNAYQYLPNYCTDLNAIHEAEKTLTGSSKSKYGYELWDVVCSKTLGAFENINAIARQRAEAFLRTLGKWENGK